MDTDLLDLPQAAAQLGVHYQTAYKWVRSGDLPAVVVGGKYRLRTADVDRFAERRAQPSPSRVRQPRNGFSPMAERCLGMMHEGDERGVRALVHDLIGDGVSLTTVLEEVIAPGLRTIGDEWHRGTVSIATEHRATAIVGRVLGDHHPTPRGRRRGTAVVVGPAGDHHGLPVAMAAAALRENNWHVHHLGTDLPSDEVIAFCDANDVDLVVLTATSDEARLEARRLERRLASRDERVLVSRPGATLRDLQSEATAKP